MARRRPAQTAAAAPGEQQQILHQAVQRIDPADHVVEDGDVAAARREPVADLDGAANPARVLTSWAMTAAISQPGERGALAAVPRCARALKSCGIPVNFRSPSTVTSRPTGAAGTMLPSALRPVTSRPMPMIFARPVAR